MKREDLLFSIMFPDSKPSSKVKEKMTRCEICGKDELLPFICSYCGKTLCSEHRLPESHDCLALPKTRPMIEKERIRSLRKSRIGLSPFRTSKIEVLHLTAGIVVFFLVEALRFRLNLRILTVVAIGVVLAFVLHELAHKFTAQYYHLWSEFRLDPFMAVLSLVTAIPWIPIKLIAPGAVQIFGYSITMEQMGKIAIAGPLVNLVEVVVFMGLSFYMPELLFVAALNADLAVFNLIPASVLDGRKIFTWNKIVWALAFTVAIAIWFFMFSL